MRWDIFCKVIDNHGDIGVCWRLAAELGRRGEQVVLWVDDPSALTWMAPTGAAGVIVQTWLPGAPGFVPRDVVVEAFGCELDAPVVAALAAQARDTGAAADWINLEYLTAEAFATRNHGLPSPVLAGPGHGLVKRFFYPGFTPATGGLLRERDLAARQATFDRHRFLDGLGVAPGTERLISLFCYEPPALGSLLAQLAAGPPTRLLVAAGRPAAAVRALWREQDAARPVVHRGSLSVHFLPLVPQPAFDELLATCDLNFVRGEDSLVRALWAGRPFVWQIYPQDDGAHLAKLQAFLDWLEAPPVLREFHAAWNGPAAALPPLQPAGWAACVVPARARLLAQDDLATQLLRSLRKTQ